MAHKYKLYNSEFDYTIKLNEINILLDFPNKKGTRLVDGEWKELTFKNIMTRTWADENPRLTQFNQLAFPVSKEMEKDFTGLVEYDEDWYPEEIIEQVIKR